MTLKVSGRLADSPNMASTLGEDRLRAVVETQTEIARAGLDFKTITDLVVRRAQGLTDARAGVMEILDGDEMVYAIVSGDAAAFLGTRLAAEGSLSGLCVSLDEALYSEDTSADDRVDHEACRQVGAGSMICVPLRHGNEVVGVLKVYSAKPRSFDQADVETLQLLGGSVAAYMANAGQFAAASHESRHDVLTGLPNRRAYDEALAKECARARRYGHPLSLCLVDLDGFKAVNDRLGHPAGDEVLAAVGEILREIRTSDQAFRIGGDEFAILMPDTPSVQAVVGAERLVNRIRGAALGGGAITASFGLADGGGDPEALHAAADEELMGVKRILHA